MPNTSLKSMWVLVCVSVLCFSAKPNSQIHYFKLCSLKAAFWKTSACIAVSWCNSDSQWLLGFPLVWQIIADIVQINKDLYQALITSTQK